MTKYTYTYTPHTVETKRSWNIIPTYDALWYFLFYSSILLDFGLMYFITTLVASMSGLQWELWKKMLPQSLLLLNNYNKAHLPCALKFTEHMHISVILRGSTGRERLTSFPAEWSILPPDHTELIKAEPWLLPSLFGLKVHIIHTGWTVHTNKDLLWHLPRLLTSCCKGKG